jgi:hypothetical protein
MKGFIMYTNEWFLEQARIGNLYHACSAGAVTLSTVSATCTGLSLANPYGSCKKLIVKTVSFQPSTAPAGAAVVGLAISPAPSSTAVVHTTPAVIHNAIMTGSDKNVGVAKVDVSSTLPAAPVWLRPMGGVVAASSISPGKYTEDVGGEIILPPGTSLSLSYLTTAAVGIASVSWAEVNENE